MKKMSAEELFEKFKEMFPNWSSRVTSYKKIGSNTLAIKFSQIGEIVPNQDEISRVFLYINENNWQFGTKLWRKRPERLEKSTKAKNKVKGEKEGVEENEE